jgi:hypothetical protein
MRATISERCGGVNRGFAAIPVRPLGALRRGVVLLAALARRGLGGVLLVLPGWGTVGADAWAAAADRGAVGA